MRCCLLLIDHRLRCHRILGRRQPFFDERIPFVALRALPERLRASVTAATADVRVQIEHRFVRELDVPANQGRVEPER